MMKTTRRKWLAIAVTAVLLLGGCASAPPENKKPDVSSLFAGNAESMEDAADEGFTGCWKYQEAEKYFYLSAEKEWKESDGETNADDCARHAFGSGRRRAYLFFRIA